MNEYDGIFTWHPQLVLISTKPVTWHGFMKINNNNNTQMKIKLTVPNYPQMKGASIKFGSKIHLMYGSDFATKITILLNNATSVLSFLNHLQRTIENNLKEKSNSYISNINWFNAKSLVELKDTLTIPGVTVSVDRELNIIKLTNKNISIQVKQDATGNSSWVVVSSDLPQLNDWELLEKCVTTLTEAANTLKQRVNALEATWEDLRIIDENCWVIDPVNPKPCHLYRRIHLNAALSILVTLNPMNRDSLQELKLLGSDSEVSKYQDILSENLNKWSDSRTIIENLLDLLEVSELPRPPNMKEYKIQANNGIVTDEECCICFSLNLDNGEMPSEVCNNEKCQRIFHTVCLYQWLAAVVGNQIAFDRIHGTCPNCNESISCRIVSN